MQIASKKSFMSTIYSTQNNFISQFAFVPRVITHFQAFNNDYANAKKSLPYNR